VKIVAAGKIYTNDVFVKTSVKKKEIGLELTIKNPSSSKAEIQVENEILPWNRDIAAAEKTFERKTVSVSQNSEIPIMISEKWENPRFWWPDDPQLYILKTSIFADGKPVDVKLTRFGFREWEWDSHLFKLNGVKWQLWADKKMFMEGEPRKFVELCRRSGMNMTRYWGNGGWGKMTRRQALDYFDEQGILVRDCGIFDGENTSYKLTENTGIRPDANIPLFENLFGQLAAWVKTERNHPSVFIWSIENEITYTNSFNQGTLNYVEPYIKKGVDAVLALDSTRPAMTDGGRALKERLLPVNGCHYNDMGEWSVMNGNPKENLKTPLKTEVTWRDYPDMAYNSRELWYKTCNKEPGVWPMAKNKPIFQGECFDSDRFAPAEYSAIGGERCFIGSSETSDAKGLYAKMLSEGWRWDEVAAWQIWNSDSEIHYNSWKPVCVFSRQWNWTFGANSEINRTLKVFNSTRFDEPIEMEWQFKIGDNKVAGEKKTFNIKAGEAQETEISFNVPHVSERTKAEFIMTCFRNGKEVFREVKSVSIINPDVSPKPAIKAGELAVIDPNGAAIRRLQKRDIPFTEYKTLDAVPADMKIIIIGKDAVLPEKTSDTEWYSLASGGRKIIVLEQKSPINGDSLQTDLEISEFKGRVAFLEDSTHPVSEGLAQSDFFTWSKDHIVYSKPYRKATKGAKSLVECDSLLNYSALTECQIGEGMILLSQLVVGEKLDSDPVAQKIFDNMLNYVYSYKAPVKNVAVFADLSTPKGKLIVALGMKIDSPKDLLMALDDKYGIAVIDATAQNLKALASAPDKIKSFTGKGGWIMLWGVTPEGLADYNKIVGFNHVLRPFQMEKVTFSAPRDPLTLGLALSDIVMDNGKEIFNFMALKFPAEDEFTYIADHTEIGPFVKFPSPEELGKPKGSQLKGWEHWPPNMVNNYTSEDSWRFCYSILLDRSDKTKWSMSLPNEEALVDFSIVTNVLYHKITKINLYFDDKPEPFTINLRPIHERQYFPLAGKKAKKITIEIADWEKTGAQNIIGIDNFWLGVKRPESFLNNVKPLINIGGLMRYNMGKGGILLNQLNILQNEENPVNAEKKAMVTKTLLMNLGAVLEK
jgi:beta-galactosidase